MSEIRKWIDLLEARSGSYRLFHGTRAVIDAFRFDNLQHRTGTPGTLSFTTSEKTARIYGNKIYEAVVTGYFGDYEDAEDVQRVFDYRMEIERSRDRSRFNYTPDWNLIETRTMEYITKGNYDRPETTME